jgi:integrase
MASISKRKRVRGAISWDAMVRVRGYPTRCKSFRTRIEAETWAARTEAAAQGRTLALGRDLTLAQLLDEAEPKLRRPVAAALNYWRDQLGALRTRDVTPSVIARHRDLLTGAPTRANGHKKTKPRSASTVRSYLALLSAVFKIGVRELRWCESNPVRDVTLPRASAGRTRFLGDDERAALLVACKASESPLLYPFVLLALTTGARRGELYALRWADVDLARRWAIFPKTKNGTSRGVPLIASVVSEMEALPRPCELVFPEVMTTAWRTAAKKAGLADFRFHDLRHSAASRLVQSGANLSEVAQLLGHKDIRMKQRYSHVHNGHTLALVDRVMEGIGS